MSKGNWIKKQKQEAEGPSEACLIMLDDIGTTKADIKQAGACFTNHIPAPVNNWIRERKKVRCLCDDGKK
jgi:hypothetical protein